MKQLFLMLFGAMALSQLSAQTLEIRYVGHAEILTKDGVAVPNADYQKLYIINALDNKILAKKNNKWGWINGGNKVLVPHEYEVFDEGEAFNLDGNSYLEKGDVIPVRKNGKWGFLDIDGKEMGSFDYDFICKMGYRSDEFWAQKKDKVYRINGKGKVLETLPYKQIWAAASCDVKDEWRSVGIFSNDGKKAELYCPETKTTLSSFACLTVNVSEWNRNTHTVVYVNNAYSLMDAEGSLLPGRYDEIQSRYGTGFYCRKGDFWGFIGLDGKEIIAPDKYKNIDRIFPNDMPSPTLFGVCNADNTWSLISPDKKAISDEKFEDISFMYDDYSIGVKKDGKWGTVNRDGLLLVRYQFDEPVYTSLKTPGNIYPAKLNGKFGYIDDYGKIVVEPQFDYATEATPSTKGYVSKDGKSGFIKINGEVEWNE